MINRAKEVFDDEIIELQLVKERIDDQFTETIKCLLETKGKVIILGIGKSGIIGNKFAASLSSTGTNAVFVNAAEGLHGDLGTISSEDTCILISNSGTSPEIVGIIPTIKEIGCKMIAMVGNTKSELAISCDHILDIGVEKEACPLNLAPTSSTTATLVMADAVTVVLMEEKKFTPSNFALYHPGGALGRRLLARVKNILVDAKELTFIDHEASLFDLVTRNKMEHGIAFVTENGKVSGIITDGDIRRNLKQFGEKSLSMTTDSIQNKAFVSLDDENMHLVEVLKILEEKHISSCPLMKEGEVLGLVKINEIYSVL